MYRQRELRALRNAQKPLGRKKKQQRLQRKIIGFCLLVFLLGFLCGRVVLAAEQAMESWLPETEEPVKAEQREEEPVGTRLEEAGRDDWESGLETREIWQEQETALVSSVWEKDSGTGYEDEQQNSDWRLRLVNQDHSLPEDFSVELTQVGDGHQVDSRIARALLDMIEAGKRDGYGIWIVSSYRTMEKQESLYEKQIDKWKRQGYSLEAAREKAGTMVAVPGTSEHQLGLAVDLVSSEYTGLDERQEETGSYQWLVKHCAEYGFILRYPNDKTEITGIIYEPWHFRYVGVEAAREIMDQGICLEEYLLQNR
ncbi:MAG: M15 family metallopeptidase [Lachnospiraceae bacterium]|nr:M15 family metallopeptidase [Lachnospiraceae bacterium]